MGGHHCFEGGMSGHVRDLGTGGGGTDMPDPLKTKREDGADMSRTCQAIMFPQKLIGGHATDMPGYYVPPEPNRRTCHGHAIPFGDCF